MADKIVLQSLVDRTFQIDPKIRYVAFADVNGLVLVGGMREGVRSYDSDEDQRLRTVQRSLSGYMVSDWERIYGEYKFNVMGFQKLTLIQFPFDELMLNISTEPDIHPIEMTRKIRDLISKPISTQI
jgi:hypothetical protein